MSQESNWDRGNLCTSAEDFDNFQAQSMYKEDEFITLSDILPPQPQIHDLASDIQEMPSESDIMALNYTVKVGPTQFQPDSHNEIQKNTLMPNVSGNSAPPPKSKRGRRRTRPVYLSKKKGKGRKKVCPEEKNIETTNINVKSPCARINENESDTNFQNTTFTQNNPGQQENIEFNNEIHHKPIRKRGRKPKKIFNETSLDKSYNISDVNNDRAQTTEIDKTVNTNPVQETVVGNKEIHHKPLRKTSRIAKRHYNETFDEKKDPDITSTSNNPGLANKSLISDCLEQSFDKLPMVSKRPRKKNIKSTPKTTLMTGITKRKVRSKKCNSKITEPILDSINNTDLNVHKQSDDDMDDVTLSKLKTTLTSDLPTDDQILSNSSDKLCNTDIFINNQSTSSNPSHIETSDLLKILEGTDDEPANETSLYKEADSSENLLNALSSSKRKTKMPIMKDFEYNIDKTVEESTPTNNDVANENDLLDVETSGRPKRRKAQKNINYGVESDEDPFANVESSDEEPRKSKKGYRYDYDHEYRPGRDKYFVSSDSSANEGDVFQDVGVNKKRKRVSKQFSTSPTKSNKKGEPSSTVDKNEVDVIEKSFGITTTDPNDSCLPDDIEECLQSSVITPKETLTKKHASTWGTTKEFENFLAQKMNSTDLKIKKTSKKNIKVPLDIPVLNPNEPKSTTDESTQTEIKISKSSSTQTNSPYSVPMKHNVPLTSEQANNACTFLKNIVTTTSELGQLMITKSEDFIKKKINTNHVVDTLKMDYCVSKSFLLFKLAKHNLNQMEEDLAKQYEEFLEKNKLLTFREKEKSIKAHLRPSNNDSDCEIVDEPVQAKKEKPKFNPKTVFLNKELSIKIAKKASEDIKEKANDKINITGKRSVWLNDSVVVKKVNPNQSFLAQDSRNKKPPDNEISKVVNDFFRDYKRQKALQTCAPFVSTRWLNINKKIVCSYFTHSDEPIMQQDSPETSRHANTTENTNIKKSLKELNKVKEIAQPHTLFSLCSAAIKTHIMIECRNKETKIVDNHDTKKQIPQTLLKLSLKKLSECITNNSFHSHSTYKKNNTHPKLHSARTLKMLCYEQILSYLFDKKGLEEVDSQKLSETVPKYNNCGIETIPQTLLILSLNKLSECTTNNSLYSHSLYKKSNFTHPKYLSVATLKILCHEKILSYMFQEKGLEQMDSQKLCETIPKYSSCVNSTPQTLMRLSLNMLSEYTTKDSVTKIYNTLHNVKLLKILCQDKILKLMFQEKCLHQPEPQIRSLSIAYKLAIEDDNICLLKNRKNSSCQLKNYKVQNNVISLATLCVTAIQDALGINPIICDELTEKTCSPKTLKYITFQIIKNKNCYATTCQRTTEHSKEISKCLISISETEFSDSSRTSTDNTFQKLADEVKLIDHESVDFTSSIPVHKPKQLVGLSVTACVDSSCIDNKTCPPTSIMTIDAVNTLSEEAFFNMEQQVVNEDIESQYFDDDNSAYNDELASDFLEENVAHHDQVENNIWTSSVQIPDIKPSFAIENLCKDIQKNYTENHPLVAQIKAEPLELNYDNVDPITIKSEPFVSPDNITIIPECVVTKTEHLENHNNHDNVPYNNTSIDGDTFESFVRSNKMMYELDDSSQFDIFSQSSLRVRRQHEPDSDPENDTHMSLLVPQTYECMNVDALKGNLLQSTSGTDEEKDDRIKEKKKIGKRKTRPKRGAIKETSNDAKEKLLDNEVSVMTRKMKERIRQEEKQIASSDSETENVPLSIRKHKDKLKSNKTNESLEIQCNNVDSTEQMTVSPNNYVDSFSGFSAVDQNETACYQKYVKYVYDKIIPKDVPLCTEIKQAIVGVSNANISETENLDHSIPLISDVPIEMIECEPTMPIFEDDTNYDVQKKAKNNESKKHNVDNDNKDEIESQGISPQLIFERHGWKCYQIDPCDEKLHQNAQIVLEKLPESFVETYFQYQDFNAKDAMDNEVARLINLNSLKKVHTRENITKNRSRRKTTGDDQKSTIHCDDSRPISRANSDHCDELTPSEDEAGYIEDELPPLVVKQTIENSLAKTCLMNDIDSDDEKLSSIKQEIVDKDLAIETKERKLKKHQNNLYTSDSLMLTADKMMNKELELLHAPVILAENIQDLQTKNCDIKPKMKNTKTSSHRNKSGNESSEEEKQWVTTKEKLLKKMEKKPEDTNIDDAKRVKLVNQFIERRNAAPELLRKTNKGWKKLYRKKKLLEQQKQMSVLSKELYGESSIVPGKKSSAAYFKGRRNIRKVIDKKSLARSTVIANMEEFERKRRLISRQNQLREVLGCEDGVSVLVINDEVCLEYDFQELQPVVTVHPFFTKVMKAHQYEGVKFMWDACFESLSLVESGHGGGGCILAHCMGLGKTLQVLALLHTVLTHPRVGMQRVLVCCPLSTVLNWVDEIHKWIGPVTDQIKVFELSKLKKTYERAFQLEDWYKGGGIFIIGYELFRSLTTLDPELDNVKVPIINKIRQALLDPGPDIIVCDEGHLLKNDASVLAVAMSRVATKRRIVLTGTPMQNNLREYYCMVNFIKPNLLGTYAEYSNRFENPIMNGQHRDSIEEDIKLMKARTHILHKVLEGCLQRQEASVLYPYLPKKHEYTVFIPVTKAQSDLYKHYLSSYAKHNKILKDFHILQKIWSHPQVLHNFQMKRNDNKIKGEVKLEDDLAQEELAANEEIKPGDTEMWWLQYLDGGNMLDALETSNKFVTLFRILDESVALGDKVLVFSTSLFTMDALEYFLKRINKWRLGREYYRLDGSVPPEVRQKWCREFNAEHNVDTKLFLISTRAGSLGLNMTAANRVVIMDTSWNPAHDIQSIFRVYRFGQKKDCFIYRLVALGTMEQKIYERSVTKQAVACRVVDEQQIDRHYNMAELTELYRFDEMGSCVAAGVAAGVSDLVLLRVARDAGGAVHAVHEHDSLLRGSSEQGLPEHERAAAWMQFEQEHATKQMQNHLRPPHADRTNINFEHSYSEALPALVPKVEKDEDYTPASEKKNKKDKKVVLSCNIPIVKTEADQPLNLPTSQLKIAENTDLDEDTVEKVTRILIQHNFSNVNGVEEISNLIKNVRKCVSSGKTNYLDSTDALTRSIAEVLLCKNSKPTTPLAADVVTQKQDDIIKKPSLITYINKPGPKSKRKRILSEEDNDDNVKPTLENSVQKESRDGRKKRKAAVAAEKHLGSIAKDLVMDLDDDDWKDNSDIVSVDEKARKSFNTTIAVNRNPQDTSEHISSVLDTRSTRGPRKSSDSVKLPENILPTETAKITKEQFKNYNHVVTSIKTESILLSDDDDLSIVEPDPSHAGITKSQTTKNNIEVIQKVADVSKGLNDDRKKAINTTKKVADDQIKLINVNQNLVNSKQSIPENKVPLHPSLLRNKNFVRIVAHTYLAGNSMLDEDAANLAAEYSTNKALEEINKSGKDLISGPIYDIAVKILGEDILKKLQTSNLKVSNEVREPNVDASNTDPKTPKDVLFPKQNVKENNVNSKIAIKNESEKISGSDNARKGEVDEIATTSGPISGTNQIVKCGPKSKRNVMTFSKVFAGCGLVSSAPANSTTTARNVVPIGLQLFDKLTKEKTSNKSNNAEKCKKYRERKKFQNVNVENNGAQKSNKILEGNQLQEINKMPKTDAQRSKEYRERQKAKKKIKLQEENGGRLKSKSTKTAAEYMREYRLKKRLKNQSTQLNTLLAENYSKAKKKATGNVHLFDTEKLGSEIEFQALQPTYQQRKQEKTLNDTQKQKAGGLGALDCQSKLQVSKERPEVLQRNSFQAPYKQYSDCAQPLAIHYHDTAVPSDGNCFFVSVIKILKLTLSPLQIRQQLLASPYINSCINPNGARSILESETEYAEMDCIDIFSRVYNQNVCVHNYFVNTNTGAEEKQFFHFKINDLQTFLHLHLRNVHFTPLIETAVKLENISSEIFADKENYGDENDSVGVNDAAPRTGIDINETIQLYTNYHKHVNGHLKFYNIFKNNTFGHSCAVCDRLWWKRDLKKSSKAHDSVLQMILQNYVCGDNVDICGTCKRSLDKGKIPLLAAYNGFTFPTIPPHLPKLNLIEQRLISPKISFMQIRRLRHVHGQYGIYGQIINIPVEVNTMVNQLPRNNEDDHCYYVHIKKNLIRKTSSVHGLINKRHIKQWLLYLVETPLYEHENITINEAHLRSYGDDTELSIDDISEHVPMEENLTAQQQTLMWNEDKMLHIAPGKRSISRSVLFDGYAEELSFPTIYGGQFRTYRDGCNVTSFMQATSELRRTDRRATDPQHLLYVAAKIMRQRVSSSVKHVGFDTKITKEDIQSEDYINSCIETNLAFLRCIPNSVWYWAERKKDLFAIIRQFGAPTAFMSLTANETGWTDLLKLLYKFKNNGAEIEDELLSEMSYVHKAQLVNEDAITCAIYFHKLVVCLLNILQSKKGSPFGKYRVKDYFKRIEFQHGGSTHAHILLWLDNAPEDLLSNCKSFTDMVDALVSVSESEASGNIELQTHKHTFTCYKNMDPIIKDNCRFGAPFLPSRNTITLMPMKDTDSDYCVEKFKEYKIHYALLKTNLENNDYDDFDHFYAANHIVSDKHYHDIIRAGIVRPTLFYRRSPSEKWNNTFNPFVFHCLQSNMDIQIIQDEYACAAYVVEYVNKHNRGISNLQQLIIQTMDENPGSADIVDITKKLSINVLHAVEMSTKEAAWYLLREPMAKSSVETVYIPTIHPTERQRIRKTLKELSNFDDDCTNTWKDYWFDMYEKRPEDLENVTLAQFVANYTKRTNGGYCERKISRVIRYRNYDMAKNFNDYRREMVLLHVPFRNEDNDVVADNKFIQIYEDNKGLILERRKEFESNLDMDKTLEICRQLGREDEHEDDEDEQLRNEAAGSRSSLPSAVGPEACATRTRALSGADARCSAPPEVFPVTSAGRSGNRDRKVPAIKNPEVVPVSKPVFNPPSVFAQKDGGDECILPDDDDIHVITDSGPSSPLDPTPNTLKLEQKPFVVDASHRKKRTSKIEIVKVVDGKILLSRKNDAAIAPGVTGQSNTAKAPIVSHNEPICLDSDDDEPLMHTVNKINTSHGPMIKLSPNFQAAGPVPVSLTAAPNAVPVSVAASNFMTGTLPSSSTVPSNIRSLLYTKVTNTVVSSNSLSAVGNQGNRLPISLPSAKKAVPTPVTSVQSAVPVCLTSARNGVPVSVRNAYHAAPVIPASNVPPTVISPLGNPPKLQKLTKVSKDVVTAALGNIPLLNKNAVPAQPDSAQAVDNKNIKGAGVCKKGDIIRIGEHGTFEIISREEDQVPSVKPVASVVGKGARPSPTHKPNKNAGRIRTISSSSSSSSSSSDDSRPASPNNPLDILKDVVHIQAPTNVTSITKTHNKAPTQSKATTSTTSKRLITNPIPTISTLNNKYIKKKVNHESHNSPSSSIRTTTSKSINSSSSSTTNNNVSLKQLSNKADALLQKYSKLITPGSKPATSKPVTSKPVTSKPVSSTASKKVTPRSNSSSVVVDLTDQVPSTSKAKHDMRNTNKTLVDGLSKNIIIRPGGKTTVKDSNHSIEPKRAHKIVISEMQTLKKGRTETVKRPASAAVVKSEFKKKRSEPMSLKDFDLDDIDDIIELE